MGWNFEKLSIIAIFVVVNYKMLFFSRSY